MKIKDTIDLANVLGMAFSGYANRVQNGAIAPYLDFIDKKGMITVDIYLLDDGSISVGKHPTMPAVEPVVETIVSPVDVVTAEEFEPCLEAEVEIIEKPEPKSKRKRKA